MLELKQVVRTPIVGERTRVGCCLGRPYMPRWIVFDED